VAKVQWLPHYDSEGKDDGKGAYLIYSPADDEYVPFDERWTFNGDFEKPTFRPSMLLNASLPGRKRNHFFVTDGKIQYLSDCEHDMKGLTIDMVECNY